MTVSLSNPMMREISKKRFVIQLVEGLKVLIA